MQNNGIALVVAIFVLNGSTANAQTEAAAAIVQGINGLTVSTQSANEMQRSAERLKILRGNLSTLLETSKWPAPIKLTFKELDVLCDSRGPHAVNAANRAYLSVISNKVQLTATPGKIETLPDAIALIFKDYSISFGPNDAQPAKQTSQQVADRCKKQAAQFPSDYYNFSTKRFKVPAVSDTGALDELLIPFNTLIGAINTVVNPLAKYWDKENREQAIADFLTNNHVTIKRAVTSLALHGSKMADYRTKLALGRYLETAAVLQAKEIKLGDECKLNFEDTEGERKQFMICHASVWKQVAELATALLKAADEYDQLADASSDRIVQDGKTLNAAIDVFASDKPITPANIWAAVVRLVNFGETVGKALSRENRDKLDKAIENLAKAL